jgi:superfamily II DNA or RNA helicase
MTNLFPFQNLTIKQLLDAIRSGYKSVLVILSCGSGKSTIFAKFTEICHGQNKRVLFLVHRRNLVRQFAERLKKQFGISSDVIMGNNKYDHNAMVLVASKDTLKNREYPDVDVVIVDEAHNAKATQFLNIINHYKSLGKVVIGLTATPERLDGSGLGDIFDTYINPIKMQELINIGRIVDVKAYDVDMGIDYSTITISQGEFKDAELYGLYDNNAAYNDIVDKYIELTPNKTFICFAVNKDHSYKLHEAFGKKGVKTAVILSETPDDEREVIYKQFREGEIKGIVNCRILIEGADFDFVEVVIQATATNSIMYYVQMTGRCQRSADGKQHGIVLDFGGNTMRHGLITMYDQKIFDLVGKKRSQKDKKEAPTKVCEHCMTVNHVSAKHCSNCRALFKIVEREVVMSTGIKMRLLEKDAIIFEKYRLMGFKDLKRLPAGSLLLAEKIRGYKNGWAVNVMKERDEVYQNATYTEILRELEFQEKEMGFTEMRKKIIFEIHKNK